MAFLLGKGDEGWLSMEGLTDIDLAADYKTCNQKWCIRKKREHFIKEACGTQTSFRKDED